tara:strand:+ start:2020 stop:2247 length:228 start_codon:yes stop_codon:yes gene_type:complete
MSNLSTIESVRAAVDAGERVNWNHEGYEVRKAGNSYNIVCVYNDSTVGLTAEYFTDDFLPENPFIISNQGVNQYE